MNPAHKSFGSRKPFLFCRILWLEINLKLVLVESFFHIIFNAAFPNLVFLHRITEPFNFVVYGWSFGDGDSGEG